MADAQLPRDADNREDALSSLASLEPTSPPVVEVDAPHRNGDPVAESVILLPPPLPADGPTDAIVAHDVVTDALPPADIAVQDTLSSSAEQLERDAGPSYEDAPPQAAEPDVAPVTQNGFAEISPIFSAIEAAERTSAAQQPLPGSHLDGFEMGLVVSTPPAPSNGHDALVAPPLADPSAAQELQGGVAPEEAPSEPVAAAASAEPTSAPPPIPEPPVEDVPPDTAARIAEEANATAVALEALKQLLAEKLPELEAAAARHAGQGSIPMLSAGGALRPLHAPVSPPPMLPAHVAAAALPYARPEAPPHRRGAMVGSFLAGFSLSWVVGAVLYMFLTAG